MTTVAFINCNTFSVVPPANVFVKYVPLKTSITIDKPKIRQPYPEEMTPKVIKHIVILLMLQQ
jgi:hypothetical protein